MRVNNIFDRHMNRVQPKVDHKLAGRLHAKLAPDSILQEIRLREVLLYLHIIMNIFGRKKLILFELIPGKKLFMKSYFLI